MELPARTVAFESTSLAIRAALQGIGVVMCAPMLVEDVRLGRLVTLDPVPVETDDDDWLLMPPGRARPDAVMFSGWLPHEMSQATPP